jgi:putative membrane protein
MAKGKWILFLCAVVLVAGLAICAGMAAIARTLGVLGLGGFAVITALHAPVLLAMGIAWWWIGRTIGGGTLVNFLAARWVRDGVAEVLPLSQLGGFLAGVRALSVAGTRPGAAAFSLFADLLMEFASKLLYLVAGLAMLVALFGDSGWRFLGAGLVLSAAAIGLGLRYWGAVLPLLERCAAWVTGKKTGPEIGLSLRPFLARGRLVPGFLLHAACWLFGAFEAWLTLRLMGIMVSGPQALVIDSLGTALRTFGFLVPAAIGVQEAGYTLVCALFGIGPAEAIAFSLARRARDLAIGLPGLALWQLLETKAAFGRPRSRPVDGDIFCGEGR